MRADTLAKSTQGNEKQRAEGTRGGARHPAEAGAEHRRTSPLQVDLASSQNAVALLLRDQGRNDDAMNMLTKSIALREALVKDEPGNAAYRAVLGSSNLTLGSIHWTAGRLADWVRSWHQGQDLMEEALPR